MIIDRDQNKVVMGHKKDGAGAPEQVKVKLRYDPFFVEEVVLHEIRRREEKGDLHSLQEYHALGDPIYEKKLSPRVRELEFEKIHAKLFMDLGFGKVIEDAILEFPEIEGIEEVFVKKAMTEHEEWVDLGQGRKRIGIRIRSVHFEDTQNLHRYLRHEFRHVADAIDEGFGHPPQGEDFPGSSPAEKTLVAGRYRTIWCTYVDGRLNRQGFQTVMDKEGRYREFEFTYRSLSPTELAATFEAIWGAEKLTHTEILEMAQDPARLLERGAASGKHPQKKVLLPGSLCPFCRFPTFHWATDLHELPEEVLGPLKGDFPKWEPEEGACDRCIEIYRVRAGIW